MIRRRLVVAVVALVAVVGGLAALAVVHTLEGRLVADVDRQLEAVPETATRLAAARVRQRIEATSGLFDVRRVAFVRVDAAGAVIGSLPSGPVDDPDPLPALGEGAGDAPAPGAGPVTLPATPGDGAVVRGAGPLRYRAVSTALPAGERVVTAMSLADVEAATADARQTLLRAGALALTAIGLAAWWTIRRGLRPVDDMAATAERIAEGHIAERTRPADPTTEVGRLGTSLDRMLDRIEEALAAREASEARMRRFVADASHELRTPLTAIRGYAELYRRGDDPGTRATAVDRIEQAATRMGGLVDDLVLLARLDRGRPLEATPVDLAALVAGAVDDARAVDPGRRLDDHPHDHPHDQIARLGPTPSVSTSPDAGPTVVTGDPARLRQVVDNLLANVREHTPPGTPASVTVTGTGTVVRLVVADAGPGMAPDEAAHAFDRFWQAPATAENPRHGTGLGLAIVEQLVAAHGGSVDLDSAPGAGTRVTVTLPAATATPTPTPTTKLRG